MVQPSLNAAAAQARTSYIGQSGVRNVAPDLHNSPLSEPRFINRQWMKAKSMLNSNPGLMTREIFCLALKYQPPLHVITSMLQLNKEVAAVPKSGPSALQVAVQSNCSAAILQVIIQANPTALVEVDRSSRFDPLTYARRFRGNEPAVLKVLSTPLSRWYNLDDELTQSSSERVPPPPSIYQPSLSPSTNLSSANDRRTHGTLPKKVSPVSFRPQVVSPESLHPHLPGDMPMNDKKQPVLGIVGNIRSLLESKPGFTAACGHPTTPEPLLLNVPEHLEKTPRTGSNKFTHMGDSSPKELLPGSGQRKPNHQVQRTELDNIKVLCLTVMKAQKKLQLRFENHLSSSQSQLNELWKNWEQQTSKAFQTQIIALDMKEKFLKKRIDRVQTKVKVLEQTKSMELDSIRSKVSALEEHFAIFQDGLSKSRMQKQRRSPHTQAPIVLNLTDPTETNSSMASNSYGHELPYNLGFKVKAIAHDEDDEIRSLLTDTSLGGERRYKILAPRKSRASKAIRSLFCQPRPTQQ